VSKPRLELEEAERQAAAFDRARSDHRSELVEDYVELIADLIDASGEARAVDLAHRLGVSGATVNAQVARLRSDGLVRSEPYRSIFLTEDGRELAEACRRRHRLVVAVLEAIGVPPEIASRDAEGIEHHVSGDTLAAFERFLGRRR
jgi:DtxR family manganese transport transcriptional regulator